MRTHFLAVLLAGLVPAIAAASTAPLALDAIVTQQQQIRSDVTGPKGRYRDLPTATREELIRRQDVVFRLIDGKRVSTDLTEKERLLAFNNLEWIEAALNDEQGEQMVCRSERTIGSNRITRVCRSAAQIAQDRERARQGLMFQGGIKP